MIPVFEIFGKSFSAYMIMALIGYLIVIYVLVKLALKNNLDEFHMLYLVLFSAIGVIIGGHILYGITNLNLLIDFIKNFKEIKSFQYFTNNMITIFGGSVFYGGMLGAIAVALIYLKNRKLNTTEYLSLAVLGIPLFHFFGRIGCFLSGCCYGVEWERGIKYKYALIEAANGVARFPVQLVEAFFNLVLFFILLHIYNKRNKTKTIYVYFTAYPICRFILEFARGDEYRGFLFGFSTSQIISIVILLTVLIVTINKKKKQKMLVD